MYSIFSCVWEGPLQLLAKPIDADGNMCGQPDTNNKDLSNYPYLFFNITTSAKSEQAATIKTVCVKYCPSSQGESISCYKNTAVETCNLLEAYESDEFLDGFCVPTDSELLSTVARYFSGFNLQMVINSIRINRLALMGCLGIAFLLSYFLSFFLSYVAWSVSWICIIKAIILNIALSVLSVIKSKELYDSAKGEEDEVTDYLKADAVFYLIIAIGLWVILASELLVFFGFSERLELWFRTLGTCGEVLSDNKEMLFVPATVLLILGALLSWWIFGGVAIYSQGRLWHDPDLPWGKISLDSLQVFQLLMHTFVVMWTISFLQSCNQFIMACSCSIWYFNRAEERVFDERPAKIAIWWLLRYHLGSIAMGSFFYLFSPLRLFFEFIYFYLSNRKIQRRPPWFGVKISNCLISLSKKVLNISNKHAYAQVSFRSISFSAASKRGIKVVSSNFVRFGILHGLGEISMSILTLFITVTGSSLGYACILMFGGEDPAFQGTAGCLLLILIIEFKVGSLFTDVWSTLAETLLHCHLIDEEIQGTTAIFSPPSLETVLNAAERGTIISGVTIKPH